MVEERIVELMQGRLDRLLSEQEDAELQRRLDADDEARAYFEELRASVEAISSLPSVDPPVSLKADIMRAIRRAQPERRSIREWISELFESRVVFNYVYALSAGIVIGVALYGMIAGLDKQGPSGSEVSGALVLTPPAAAYQPVEEVGLDTLGITMNVRTRTFQLSHIAECTLQSTASVTAVVEFEAGALSLAGFSQSERTPETVGIQKNRIELTSTGSNSYLFLFESRSASTPSQTLRITLTAPGGTVRRTVQLF